MSSDNVDMIFSGLRRISPTNAIEQISVEGLEIHHNIPFLRVLNESDKEWWLAFDHPNMCRGT